MVLLTPTKVLANKKIMLRRRYYIEIAQTLPFWESRHFQSQRLSSLGLHRWSVKSTNPPLGGYKMLTNSNSIFLIVCIVTHFVTKCKRIMKEFWSIASFHLLRWSVCKVVNRPPGDWCGTHLDDRYVIRCPSRLSPTNRPAVGWLPFATGRDWCGVVSPRWG